MNLLSKPRILSLTQTKPCGLFGTGRMPCSAVAEVLPLVDNRQSTVPFRKGVGIQLVVNVCQSSWAARGCLNVEELCWKILTCFAGQKLKFGTVLGSIGCVLESQEEDAGTGCSGGVIASC